MKFDPESQAEIDAGEVCVMELRAFIAGYTAGSAAVKRDIEQFIAGATDHPRAHHGRDPGDEHQPRRAAQ